MYHLSVFHPHYYYQLVDHNAYIVCEVGKWKEGSGGGGRHSEIDKVNQWCRAGGRGIFQPYFLGRKALSFYEKSEGLFYHFVQA